MFKLRVMTGIAATTLLVATAGAAEQPKSDAVPMAGKAQTNLDWKTRQMDIRRDQYLRSGSSEAVPLPQNSTPTPKNPTFAPARP